MPAKHVTSTGNMLVTICGLMRVGLVGLLPALCLLIGLLILLDSAATTDIAQARVDQEPVYGAPTATTSSLLSPRNVIFNNDRIRATSTYPIQIPGQGTNLLNHGADEGETSKTTDLMFIRNEGQFDERVHYVMRGGPGTLHFTSDAVWVTVMEPMPQSAIDCFTASADCPYGAEQSIRGVSLKFSFVGANPSPNIVPINPLPTTVSYLKGNDPSEWHPNAAVYDGIRYENIYPYIDVEYSGEGGQWQPQLIIKPGADLSQVAIQVDGADSLSLTENGHLRLTTVIGQVELPLFTTQNPVESLPKPKVSEQIVRFPFAEDRAKQPISNPGMLFYSTFLGQGYSHSIAVSIDGAAYTTGTVYATNFPVTLGAIQTTLADVLDIFVAKLANDGSELEYVAYIGGSGNEGGLGIAVDDSDTTYITGSTDSTDFPTTSGAFQENCLSACEYYYSTIVVKLNADGTDLVYSTYLGNIGFGYAIAVDDESAAYVTGIARDGFPTTLGAWDTTFNGGRDAYITKLNAVGSALIYSTYLGGGSDGVNNLDIGMDIAVDDDGAAYVVGYTSSTDFPTTSGAFDEICPSPCSDGFVTKLNASGSALAYSTYLGGTSGENISYGRAGIAVNDDGEAFVTGHTSSDDFPVTPGAFQDEKNEFSTVAYVTKFNSDGSELIYSTYLGGSSPEFSYTSGIDIAVNDSTGEAYITGLTTSTDYPTTADAFQNSFNGELQDSIVTVLNIDGSELVYSTYLGGSNDDIGNGIALSAIGNPYVTGGTWSIDFPTTPGAAVTTLSGESDGFVTKFDVKSLSISPGQDWNVECPFCSVADTQAVTEGIHPRTGAFVYQETFLDLPVQGGNLAFQPSYISAATDFYTATMGVGWVHNFDIQLHFTNTLPTHTVILQAPGGSRFPYVGNGDGTYQRYYGVTAEMERFNGTNPEDTEYIITTFNQNVFTFDAAGKLVKQEDPAGNVITLTYNTTTGLLEQVTQAGRYLEYEYYPSNRLKLVRDNEGREILLTYTGDDLTGIRNANFETLTYEYNDEAHLLTDLIDDTQTTLKQIDYDGEGRAYRVRDGAGNVLVEIDYGSSGLSPLENTAVSGSRVVTVSGVVLTYTYNTRGVLAELVYACTESTSGCQTDTRLNYDPNFKPTRQVDANGNRTLLSWNEGGSNLESLVDALNNVSTLGYDSYNNLTQVVNARGMTTTYGYHNPAFPTFRTHIMNTLGQTTIYTATAGGLLGQERDSVGRVISYTYNTYGQVTQIVNGYGSTTAVTTTYGYDDVGRLQTTMQTSAGESHTALNVYDATDRLLATIANWTGNDPDNWEADCDTSGGARESNICTRYTYDAAGRTISTTNTLDQTDLTFYDSAGRVEATVTNWDGSSYSGYGDLCNFNNPDPEFNLCALTGYDTFGRVVTRTGSLGRQTVSEYDALGRVSRTVVNWEDGVFSAADPDSDVQTLYAYDAVGNTIIVTDTLGRMTRTFYDPLNRVEATVENWQGTLTSAEAVRAGCFNLEPRRDSDLCTAYQYDEVGNTIIVTDTLGRMTRTFYDELNRVTATVQNWNPATLDEVTDCLLMPGNDAVENVCTLYGYDPAGNQITVTNALDQTSLTVYDALNRPFIQVSNWDGTPIDEVSDCSFPPAQSDVNLCQVTSYDALGRRSSTTDPLGRIATFTYDGLGRVITTTRYLGAQAVTSVTYYDGLGNRLQTLDANGHATSYAYDSLNRLVQTVTAEGVATTTAYDAAGRVITSTNGLGQATVNAYDELDQLVSTTDPLGHVTQQTYDALGNRTVMTDAAGLVTRYHYDGLNRLMAVIEHWDGNSACVPSAQAVADNLCTQYVYDALGNRVVITNALAVSTTLTLYDSLNRPVLVADALGHRTQSAYDALGNRTVMTDANGATTYYAYDGLNRLITTTYTADNEVVVFTYDALGNRTAMQDGLGMTSYIYDELNRLITVTSPFTGVVGYGYDLVGNRTRLTYPDGRQLTYDYDGDHRLITVTSWLTGTASYAYDPAGRLVTTTLPNGVVTVNTYDAAGRLTNLHHESAMGMLLANYAYELDQVGNRLVATETLRLPEGLTAAQRLPDDATGADQALPAVAGNTAGYLTVWQDGRDGSGWAIYGQRISHEGTPVGSNLVITDTGQTPAVAAGPEGHLVVWESAGEIWATFVDNVGQVEASFMVAGAIVGGGPAGQPDVVYDATNDTFLVAWRREPSAGGSIAYLIQARTVSPAGSLGTVYTLATQVREMLAPAVAVNDSGTFLVVWQDRRNGANYDIQAQRLTASGLTGSNFAITSGNPNEQLPDVAWNSLAEVFLVVWHDNQDIWARPVNSNGTFPNAAYRVYDTTTTNPAAQAAVAGRQDTTTFLAAWRQQTSIGYRIDAQEVTLTTTVGSPVNLASHTLNLAAPAVATTGNEAQLVAWQQQPSSEQDIYARAIRPGGLQTATITYDYDPLYRLTTAVYTGALSATYAYAYDGVGNRLVYTATLTSTEVITYAYDAANRLATSMADGSTTTTYDWDNMSRLITTTVGSQVARVYDYSQDGDLTLAVVDGITTTFSYDGLGHRLLMSVAGEVVTYTVDYAAGGRVLFEEGGQSKHYLYGYACLAEVVEAGTANEEVRVYQRDGNSMVRQTTNEAVEVTYAWSYTPEGMVLVGEEGVVTHLDCGADAVYDWSTGLIFKNGGYFDPTLGLWLALTPFVVWQSQGRRKRRRGRTIERRWLFLLFIFLIAMTVAGCAPTPDPTGTPQATPTCTPTPVDWTTLPSPIVGTNPPKPPASPTPLPTSTPRPTETPIPPTPTPELSGFILQDPFGTAGGGWYLVCEFGAGYCGEPFGNHSGVDLVSKRYIDESCHRASPSPCMDPDNLEPRVAADIYRDVYAPVSGLASSQGSTVFINDVTHNGIVIEGLQVQLDHVRSSGASNVTAGVTKIGEIIGYGEPPRPHLHLQINFKDKQRNPLDYLDYPESGNLGAYWNKYHSLPVEKQS